MYAFMHISLSTSHLAPFLPKDFDETEIPTGTVFPPFFHSVADFPFTFQPLKKKKPVLIQCRRLSMPFPSQPLIRTPG